MDLDVEAIKTKLAELKAEHRKLDEQTGQNGVAGLQLQRLKRRKLALKDQIAKLESQLLPDIIA